MATFRDAERPYDQPDSPRRRTPRSYIDPVDGPQGERPDDYPEPCNIWMADELAPLDRATLAVLADAEGPVTLSALEVALAPPAAADRHDRETIRAAACMLDALHFANITDWDDNGQPCTFTVLPDGREAHTIITA